LDTQNRAEIISVGNELLRGEIIDTNAGFLAAQLPILGIELYRMTTAGDSIEELSEVLTRAQKSADVVLITGGLGPTEDDLTREAIAAVMGEEPAVDAGLENQLRELFGRMGREMPSHNLKQAWLIPSARALDNPLGTAPGWWVHKDGKTIVAMPGPPREMTVMWRNEVKPRLQEVLPDRTIISKTIKIYGIPEAEVAEMVQHFFETDNPSLGIYAHLDGIHLRLIARGNNAQGLLREAEEKMTAIFGSRIWGRDDDTLEELIGGWLNNAGLTLATIEDGTGGLVANMLAKAPGGHQYFRGGLVVCSDDVKITCGIPSEVIATYGAVSPEVTVIMAAAVRERFSADIGLSTSAVMPKSESEGRPAGLTCVGISDSYGEKNWTHNFARFRDPSGQREAYGALFRLRERLLELGIAD
jgi:nicotinamide-nucleotide amidase